MCQTNTPTHAELAELVDALDSGSSVRKDFRVQVPGSAFGRKWAGESWADICHC
ncbi:conserved protein of unknown function [Limnospira indica PCC 8005]|uniref:Uncharacterized protein n=1 Tax=Limnospira indica PCC 8005 TaxID=376219 RepID=A0A9P1KHB2_9CYAN|nr:conserved protein of unknown function [Limnospira indica PCC 8005]